jgi:hypothetical protein
MAEITRDQFDPTKRVQKKIFQRGTHVVDADLNEQADVALESRRRILSCLIDHTNVRFDDGFLVSSDPWPLTLRVGAGNAAFHLDEPAPTGNRQLATIVHHAELSQLTGFDSWVDGGVTRTDLIYLDVEEKEISPSDDSNIVNPLVGAETCRDIRVEYEIKIAKGTTTLPDAPTGHIYHKLATITKDESSDYILTGEIMLLLPDYKETAATQAETIIWCTSSESFTETEAVALDSDSKRYRLTSTGGYETNVVIKIPYMRDPAHTYLCLRYEGFRASWGPGGTVTLKYGSHSNTSGNISETTLTVGYSLLDVSEMVEGQIYTLEVLMAVSGQNEIFMQRCLITAGLGWTPNFHPGGV